MKSRSPRIPSRRQCSSLPAILDVDGDVLTIIAKTNGTNGTVAITGGGTGLTYRPNPNFSGDDSFTYTISDGHLSDTGTVTVHVGGANDPPIAAPDEFHVAEGAKATALLILDNDFDPDGNPVIVFSKTAALHGTVAITGNGTGLTYDPTGNYSGPDKFKYTITDGNGEFSTATVLITVDKDATPPVGLVPGRALPGADRLEHEHEAPRRLERHRRGFGDRAVPVPDEHERGRVQDGHALVGDVDLVDAVAQARLEVSVPGPRPRS